MPSPAAATSIQLWLKISSRRRSTMSARAPAANDNKKHRQGACRLNQRHHQRRRRKLGHEPACADLLHHRADIGSDGSNPQDAEEFVLEGDPGRRDGSVLPSAGLSRQVRTCAGLSAPMFESAIVFPEYNKRVRLRDPCGEKSGAAGGPKRCEERILHFVRRLGSGLRESRGILSCIATMV